MLEPLHQAGQWAWQQAASKANMVSGNLPALGSSVPPDFPHGLWPQSSNEQTHTKGFKPILPEKPIWQSFWNRARQTLQQIPEKLKQRLGRQKPPAKPDLKPQTPASGFRPRQQILKDFPYNEVGKLPRFTLSPDEISVNPAAERLHQLEAAQVFHAPWDSDHLFNPFMEH